MKNSLYTFKRARSYQDKNSCIRRQQLTIEMQFKSKQMQEILFYIDFTLKLAEK